jgi:dTDP-4-amino-4,6-dideoxygalactose transaminase
VARLIGSGWYVHGSEHSSFEAEPAQSLGVRHVADVASGTDALVLAMLAVGCNSTTHRNEDRSGRNSRLDEIGCVRDASGRRRVVEPGVKTDGIRPDWETG